MACGLDLPSASLGSCGEPWNGFGFWGKLEFVQVVQNAHGQSQRPTGLAETTMSSSLPPEILDLIIDNLHDEPTALKTCCIVSKSWVPRTRKHLFAHVKFYDGGSHIGLWRKAFPDPVDSPAHHTRSFFVHGAPVINGADVGNWIRTFRNVVRLQVSYMDRTTLLPFYGLSPAIRSLSLIQVSLDAFDLACSFPLLEDLSLVALYPKKDGDGWTIPPTSPKLTGALNLRMFGKASSVTRRLLDLPGGLHFSNITATFPNEDAKSVADLVSACSGTLEFLTLRFRPQGAFPSAPTTGQYPTTTHPCRRV